MSRVASRIGSLLRQTLAAVWLFAIPKELWGLLCIWPTLFLAAASYFWEPSGRGLRLILLAVIWDVVMGAWLTTSAMKKARDGLAAMIARLRDCTYTPIRWSRVLRGDDESAINQSSLMALMGRMGLPYDHGKDVRFFRVDMGESGVIPGGLGAFNIPFIETVVLVRDDDLENATVEDRFCLYHELGHTLGDEFAVQSALHKGVKLPLTALMLAAVAMHPTTSSLLALSMCVVGVSMIGLAMRRRRKSSRAVNEMKADQFAIGFLDDSEKRHILEHADSVLSQDDGLSAWEHQERVISLKALIETGDSPMKTHPGASYPGFILEVQLAALNLGAWMILLAGFIGAPTARLVNGFQWLIAGTFALGVLRFAIHYWKGILLELIFIERITWQDGKFQIRKGPSRAPAPEPTT